MSSSSIIELFDGSVIMTGDINPVCFRWETIILISMYGIYIMIMK